MRKKIVAIIIFVVVTIMSVLSVNASIDDITNDIGEIDLWTTEEKKIDTFKNYKWGSTLDEIDEIKELINGVDYLLTKKDDGTIDLFLPYDTVAEMNCSTIFSFSEKNGLTRGSYVLSEKHTTELLYYEDFLTLKEKLESIYGKPDKYDETWKDELYKDNPEKIGLSIATGRTKIECYWHDKEKNILLLAIRGDNYDIGVSISYFSSNYETPSNTNGL